MAKENEIFLSCMTCFYYVPGLGFPESRVMSFPIASALPGPDSRSVEVGSEVTEVVVGGSKLFRAPGIRIQYSSYSYLLRRYPRKGCLLEPSTGSTSQGQHHPHQTSSVLVRLIMIIMVHGEGPEPTPRRL